MDLWIRLRATAKFDENEEPDFENSRFTSSLNIGAIAA